MLVEVSRRDAPFAVFADQMIGRAETHHHRRHVVAGVAVGDVAPDRADIPHLRIGDDQRRFREDRRLGGDNPRGQQFVLGGGRADDEVRPVLANAFEFGDRAEIDEVGRFGEAELHHRNEAVPARQRARLLAQVAQQSDGLGNRLGAMVIERGRNHMLLPAAGDANVRICRARRICKSCRASKCRVAVRPFKRRITKRAVWAPKAAAAHELRQYR